jgi:hypothetical protein
MADTKLSALTELSATPADADELYIRDVSEAATDESKRITVANLKAAQTVSVKAWCEINAAGDLSSPDYNIAGVGDTGAGDRDISFTVPFSSGVYAAVCTSYQAENQNQHFQMTLTEAADVQLKCYVGTSLTDLDTTQIFAGDQ